MNDDEIKEFSLLDDEQTKFLEYFEKHPEEQEKLMEAVKQLAETLGEAIGKLADILLQTVEAFANLAANLAEAEIVEEEENNDNK